MQTWQAVKRCLRKRKQERQRVFLWLQELRVFGAGLALNEEEIYYIPVEGMITEGYLCGKLEGLLHKVSNLIQYIMESNTDDVKRIRKKRYLMLIQTVL